MIRTVTVFVLMLLSLPIQIWAAGDSFVVSQLIGDDTVAPSIPQNVIATAQSATQVGLLWDAATDADSGVAGYQVFRNTVQIATTTNTSYTDIGLLASTTYDYTVTAFDLFLNISAHSATSSTTTLPVTSTTTPSTTPPSTTNTGGNGVKTELDELPPRIENLEINIGAHDAVVSFATPGRAISTIWYGVTPAYEIGSVTQDIYSTQHQFSLTELETGIRYYYEIRVANKSGDIQVYRNSFVTQQITETNALENVSFFTANKDGSDVVISWSNPVLEPGSVVRVIANNSFFPLDPADGRVIYEGTGESYRQLSVYPQYTEMYYTAFVLREGESSSGMLAYVTWPSERPTVADTISINDLPSLISSSSSSTTTDSSISSYVLMFGDLEFIQNHQIHVGVTGVINLDPHQSFMVRIPYTAVPEHLKAIVLTLIDPEDSEKAAIFLLRINTEKTYYQAVIGPLQRNAQFPLSVRVFDFQTKIITAVEGTVSTVPQSEQAYPDIVRTIPEQLLFVASRFWYVLTLLCILLFFILFWKRRRRNESVS